MGYEGTIIGVTGNVLHEDVDYFKEKGANDVLPKPVSMKLLKDYWATHQTGPQSPSSQGKEPRAHGVGAGGNVGASRGANDVEQAQAVEGALAA